MKLSVVLLRQKYFVLRDGILARIDLILNMIRIYLRNNNFCIDNQIGINVAIQDIT